MSGRGAAVGVIVLFLSGCIIPVADDPGRDVENGTKPADGVDGVDPQEDLRVPPQGSELALWYLDDAHSGSGRTADATRHGLDLEYDPDMFTVVGPRTHLTEGLVFRDDGDHLTSHNGALRIPGDLSITMAFEVDSIDANILLIGHGAKGDTADTNYVYEVRIQANGNLVYKHEYGAGNDFQVEGLTPVDVGYHTLTLQRDVAERSVVLKLDGEIALVGTWTPGRSPSDGSGGFFSMGRYAVVGNLDGAIYEARIWGQVIDQATLDKIVDP